VLAAQRGLEPAESTHPPRGYQVRYQVPFEAPGCSHRFPRWWMITLDRCEIGSRATGEETAGLLDGYLSRSMAVSDSTSSLRAVRRSAGSGCRWVADKLRIVAADDGALALLALDGTRGRGAATR
jgi:hypothetical protein